MAKTQTPTNFIKHTHKNPLQRFLINNFYKALINECQKITVRTILDAGCGEGFTLNKLKQSKIGKDLQGLENSKEAIDLAKQYFPNLKIDKGNIYNLPYKDDSFGLVISTEVLEHLDNPEKALSELKRISKKYLLLSVPNEPFFMLSNLIRGKNITRFGNPSEHINHWTASAFKRFVADKKFKVLRCVFPFPWTIILLEKSN